MVMGITPTSLSIPSSPRGDKVDSIPGVFKIGEKMRARLKEHGSVWRYLWKYRWDEGSSKISWKSHDKEQAFCRKHHDHWYLHRLRLARGSVYSGPMWKIWEILRSLKTSRLCRTSANVVEFDFTIVDWSHLRYWMKFKSIPFEFWWESHDDRLIVYPR